VYHYRSLHIVRRTTLPPTSGSNSKPNKEITISQFTSSFLGLLFDPEDRGSMLFRNVSTSKYATRLNGGGFQKSVLIHFHFHFHFSSPSFVRLVNVLKRFSVFSTLVTLKSF
jgi:hypothetical protein